MPLSAPVRTRRTSEPALSDCAVPEAVEVRCGSDDAGAPAQFLWRSRLWLVREADPGLELEPVPARGCWRVLAGQGPGRSQGSFWLWQDGAGRWWLLPVPA
jgi:hypothetical protein